MISVAEAKALVQAHVTPLPPQRLPLGLAGGLVLAEDVFSPAHFPPFAQSSMDGYAFCLEDAAQWDSLRIAGEVAAGSSTAAVVERGTAVRIFTGAPLPPGADVVVMQEKTRVAGDRLFVLDENLQKGSNVRPQGSEVKQGERAIAAGTLLSPAAIGMAASMGLAHLPVCPPPAVVLLITGKELVPPGQPLASGCIYDANSAMLTEALKKAGIQQLTVQWVDDNLETLKSAFRAALQQHDLVLVTGGVSVGDYDFVVPAAASVGVQPIFHKVAQKPGKPLFFGKRGRQIFFGLPGNPASVLTCFYQYVLPVIGQMMHRPYRNERVLLPLLVPVTKPPGLTQFLKGKITAAGVLPLGAQESFRLRSFAEADCLIQLEPHLTTYAAGAEVQVYRLPY